MDYDNNNTGVLFKNDRKEKPNQPDYKGSAEVDDVEYWIAAWIKEGKKGKFMSLSFTAKEPKRNSENNPDYVGDNPSSSPDDDIPF